jgi:hypothetical protein
MATCFGCTFNHHQALKEISPDKKHVYFMESHKVHILLPGLISLRPDDG